MFKIEAPYPGYQTTVLLPSPSFGDSEEIASSLVTARAMDGTLYTYAKQREGRRRLQYSFVIARGKGLELRAFLKAYYRTAMRITDHDDNIWIVYLQGNPFDIQGQSKAGGFPGGETMTVNLQFEERE
jgi:hypothetical protein